MKYKNSEGEVFTAVQFHADKPLPEGMFKETVTDITRTYDDKGAPVEEKTEVEKIFIGTKDSDGDYNIKGAFSSIGDGVWILTDKDGNVSLCHPLQFDRDYKETK